MRETWERKPGIRNYGGRWGRRAEGGEATT